MQLQLSYKLKGLLMARFEIEKRGYSTDQVDKFINTITLKYEEKLSQQKDRVFSLKKEIALLNERLATFEHKDKQVSKALISAVEKAEQIENSARKIYDLEVRRIRLLYRKWEEIVARLEEGFPIILTDGKMQFAIDEFNSNIKSVIRQNEKFEQSGVKEDLKKNSDNYIKNLLNRMDYIINEKSEKSESGKIIQLNNIKNMEKQQRKEKQRLESNQKRFSPNVLKNKNFDTYLSDSKVETNNAYAKVIAPKQVYKPVINLEDILQPKEELEEIMKAFDFYNEEQARRKFADENNY